MNAASWPPGTAPVAVVMISRDEAHNMEAVLQNLAGWAREVFLLDSLSRDDTVEIALRHGVHVVQRRFRGFGDQWNYALRELPITAPYTMKLDPDERITDAFKREIAAAMQRGDWHGLAVRRRLWFMGRPLPVRDRVLRIWKTGAARFSDVAVNEHPIVNGKVAAVSALLEHLDSPNLHHWLDKQNRYSTAEAASAFADAPLAAAPKLFGDALQRRMWLKRAYARIPLRHQLMYLYCLLVLGAWRAGREGFIWAHLRAEVFRMKEFKLLEMRNKGQAIELVPHVAGPPHPGAIQADDIP